MELLEIRGQIDSIDSEIINLLAKRAELVSAAGKLKKNEQDVRDPKRVEQVIERARSKAASSGLSPEIAERFTGPLPTVLSIKNFWSLARETKTSEGIISIWTNNNARQ